MNMIIDVKNELINNINKIHTTLMGVDRIKNNLKLSDIDVVEYLINKIKDKNSYIYKNGKNYYVEIDHIIITVNSYSFTIITAHKLRWFYEFNE